WTQNKNMTSEQWLHMRLGYQTSRAQRLEGEVMRARAREMRLQQLLYNRLAASERFTHIQSLLDHEDPNVRGLAVIWSVEMLPAADAERKKGLGEVLLRLSSDSHIDVQRAAVLGLGRIDTSAAFERLRLRLKSPRPGVRAAAARALAVQA